LGVGRQDPGTLHVGGPVPPAGGGALDGVAVRELVVVALADVPGPERAGAGGVDGMAILRHVLNLQRDRDPGNREPAGAPYHTSASAYTPAATPGPCPFSASSKNTVV